MQRMLLFWQNLVLRFSASHSRHIATNSPLLAVNANSKHIFSFQFMQVLRFVQRIASISKAYRNKLLSEIFEKK